MHLQFHKYFHVRLLSNTERSFESALALALETQEGTAEEVISVYTCLTDCLCVVMLDILLMTICH